MCAAAPDEGRGDWVACLSASAVRSLAEMIRARYPGIAILEVHAGTARDIEVRACFQDPSRLSRYRVVVCSPSCGTGVDEVLAYPDANVVVVVLSDAAEGVPELPLAEAVKIAVLRSPQMCGRLVASTELQRKL